MMMQTRRPMRRRTTAQLAGTDSRRVKSLLPLVLKLLAMRMRTMRKCTPSPYVIMEQRLMQQRPRSFSLKYPRSMLRCKWRLQRSDGDLAVLQRLHRSEGDPAALQRPHRKEGDLAMLQRPHRREGDPVALQRPHRREWTLQ